MNSLKELIWPETETDFISKILNKQSFLIKSVSKKLHTFFSLEKFYTAIYFGEINKPRGFRLGKFIPPKQNILVNTMTSEEISFAEVSSAIDEGLTICVTKIELCDTTLFNFVQSLKKELHFLGEIQINCYLSPNDSGASLHFDARMGIIVQIEGAKRWKFASTPSVEYPRANAQINSEGQPVWASPIVGNETWENLDSVNDSELNEAVLEPGDVLCIQAGTWHSAKASDYSLALNISFTPYDYGSLFMQLMDAAFFKSPDWRCGPLPFIKDLENKENDYILRNWNEQIDNITNLLQQYKNNPVSINTIYEQLK